MLKSAHSLVFLLAVLLIFSIILNSHVFSEANALQSQATSILTSGSIQYPVGGNSTMWLHAEGTKISNTNGEEVIWNGIDSRGLFGYWIYPEESFLSANDVQIIRSHGLNFIRVDIGMDMAVRSQPMGTPTQLNYDPNFWQLLDEIVNAAAKNGIWVSIDFACSDGTWSNIGGFWGDGNGFPAWMYNGSWTYFNQTYTNDATGRSNAIRDFWNIDDPTAANVRTAYQTFWKDIANRYKDSPNVIFNLFNEPQNQWGGPTLWDGVNGHPTQAQGAQMFQTFMEQTIDIVRAQDNGSHIIIINNAYFWYWASNPQIRRPNIVIENHAYWIGSNMTSNVQGYAQLAWRYNQPFFLGEFGGVEQSGLQDRTSAIATMQACNQLDVGWSYLRYNPSTSGGGPSPSAQTWTDIENNLRPNLKY